MTPGELKTYLGDGAYAECDGGVIVLTTEDGIRTSNRIVLEPEHVALLVAFCRRVGVLTPENDKEIGRLSNALHAQCWEHAGNCCAEWCEQCQAGEAALASQASAGNAPERPR